MAFLEYKKKQLHSSSDRERAAGRFCALAHTHTDTECSADSFRYAMCTMNSNCLLINRSQHTNVTFLSLCLIWNAFCTMINDCAYFVVVGCSFFSISFASLRILALRSLHLSLGFISFLGGNDQNAKMRRQTKRQIK